MAFFRYDGTIANNQGIAIAGANIYVCAQPVTTSLSPIAIPPSPLVNLYATTSSNSATITGATWAGGFIAFVLTTTAPADVVVGSWVAITGVSPATYNAVWLVTSVAGAGFTVVSATNPGTYVSGGTVATSALPNPLTSDGNGNFFFYVPTSSYTVIQNDPYGRIPTIAFPDQVVLAPGGGSVSSVGLALPATEFTVSGSPVTTSGTLTAIKASQNANFIWAGPTSGAAAAPTFRALVAADLTGVAGTVSSVGLAVTVPGYLTSTITNSPVTSTGTLTATITANNQAVNTILAGPSSGSTGATSFRALVPADLPGQTAVVFSPTPTFNAASVNSFTITLTNNVTSSSISNPTTGQMITFIITQNSSGGYTFAWPTNFKGASAIAPDPNIVSVQSFVYDGANWRATGPGLTM